MAAETKVADPAVREMPASAAALPVPVKEAEAKAPVPMRVGLLGAQLSPVQIELLKATAMRGATDDEVAVFVHVCNRTGLDPFVKQIHAVKRRTKNEETNQYEDRWAHQVGIDGFRLVADRTGKYDGRLEPEFFDDAGNARTVWLDKKPPRACRIGVLRKGIKEPFYVTALWDEYVQIKRDGSATKQWKEKPTIMLAKCAEAAAIRAAFPQELSGVYAPEELMRSDEVDEGAEHEFRPATAVRVKPAEPEALQARATEDGDAILLFGRFKDKRVTQLPLEDLTGLVAGWNDPDRKALAESRLGAGTVSLIAATWKRKKAEAEAAADPSKLPERIERIVAVLEAGKRIEPDAEEELRQFVMDHPESADAIAARLPRQAGGAE